MEEKCREKLQLFHDAQVIVYNSDDDTISRCIRSSAYKGEKIGWKTLPCPPKDSTSGSYAAGMYVWVERNDESTTASSPLGGTEGGFCSTIHYIYKGTQGTYHLPFIDEASVQCSIACACVALYLGVTPEDLDARMSHLEPVAMRLEVKEGRHGCTLINDSYNSDINSLDIALDFMSRRPDHNGRRRTLILSDIYQSGERPETLYKEVSDLAVKRGVERFVGIGDAICAHADAIAVADKWFFADVQQFIASPLFHSLRDEVILITGSTTSPNCWSGKCTRPYSKLTSTALWPTSTTTARSCVPRPSWCAW